MTQKKFGIKRFAKNPDDRRSNSDTFISNVKQTIIFRTERFSVTFSATSCANCANMIYFMNVRLFIMSSTI